MGAITLLLKSIKKGVKFQNVFKHFRSPLKAISDLFSAVLTTHRTIRDIF
jgi:hypothetical protein